MKRSRQAPNVTTPEDGCLTARRVRRRNGGAVAELNRPYGNAGTAAAFDAIDEQLIDFLVDEAVRAWRTKNS